jgi:hypothetical protein
MTVGQPRFLEMAVDMALSLREHTAHPIALATDPVLAERTEALYPRVFDHVTQVPTRFLRGRGRKYGTAEASPFDETMFVDADCIVLAPLEQLWSALEEHDMAMVGSPLSLEHDQTHHGFSTRWLIRRFGLERYLKTNSGLFCFRRPAAVGIMEECLDCFLTEVRPALRLRALLGGWVGDEIAFGVVGGRRGIGTLPVPSPMFWPEDFEAMDLTEPARPLLHLIWPPPPAVVDELVEGMRMRRRAAGVPGDAETHWREEVRRLESMVRRDRWRALLRLR